MGGIVNMFVQYLSNGLLKKLYQYGCWQGNLVHQWLAWNDSRFFRNSASSRRKFNRVGKRISSMHILTAGERRTNSKTFSRHWVKVSWMTESWHNFWMEKMSAKLWNQVLLALASSDIILVTAEEFSVHLWIHVRNCTTSSTMVWWKLAPKAWIHRRMTLHSRWYKFRIQAKSCWMAEVGKLSELFMNFGINECKSWRSEDIAWGNGPRRSLFRKRSRGNPNLSKSVTSDPPWPGTTMSDPPRSGKSIVSSDSRISGERHLSQLPSSFWWRITYQ